MEITVYDTMSYHDTPLTNLYRKCLGPGFNTEIHFGCRLTLLGVGYTFLD